MQMRDRAGKTPKKALFFDHKVQRLPSLAPEMLLTLPEKVADLDGIRNRRSESQRYRLESWIGLIGRLIGRMLSALTKILALAYR